jgi:hypothetical protein
MRCATAILLGFVIACALGELDAAAQPAPCNTCQPGGGPPCGCAGHQSGCCCDGLCNQLPPNPLAPGRPSPPPCCADGYCYPNYETWGHYKTRWRRWPIELAATAPSRAPTTPSAPRPDVPSYEVLPPEEEDRRAPPPSAPRGESVQTAPREAAPREGAEETRPTPRTTPTSPTPPQTTPDTDLSPEAIFGEPPAETPPAGVPMPGAPMPGAPSPGAPIEETPDTMPLAPPAGGETSPTPELPGVPMGDEDLPPSFPFATPKLSKQTSGPSTSRPAAAAPKSDDHTRPQDDPPPQLPSGLASLSN